MYKRKDFALRYDTRYKGIIGFYFREIEEAFVWEKSKLFVGKTILDLGTGTGRLLDRLSKIENGTILSVDVSIEMLEVAYKKVLENTKHNKNIIFLFCSDGKQLALQDNSIDITIALGTFHRSKKLGDFLQEVKRVSKKGGYFIFSLWNKKRWFNIPFFQLDKKEADYCLEDIRRQLRKYDFEILDVQTIFYMPRTLFWMLYKLLLVYPLKVVFMLVAIRLEKLLGRISGLKMRGWELLILAQEKTTLKK